MAQDPFQVDQLQIEPASGNTIKISMAVDGSIQFVDAVVTSAVKLTDICGIQSVDNVFVVGAAGAGASHTTVQAALDDVPSDSSDTNPYVILVASGSYQEDITIIRNGVTLLAIGYVLLQSATATDTITIQENVSVPQYVRIEGFHIKNSNASQSCVRVVGGSTSNVGLLGINLLNCHFVATGAGSYPVRAASACRIAVYGGSMSSSAATAVCLVEECAEFCMKGVLDISSLQLDYDNLGTLSSVVGNSYRILDCNSSPSSTADPFISSNLSGAGALLASNCSSLGNVTLDGDRTFTFHSCKMGALVATSATTIVKLTSCTRGVASGLGVLHEDRIIGELTYANTTTQTFSFEVQQPDLNYAVLMEPKSGNPFVSNKAVGSFAIDFAGQTTTSFFFSVIRDV